MSLLLQIPHGELGHSALGCLKCQENLKLLKEGKLVFTKPVAKRTRPKRQSKKMRLKLRNKYKVKMKIIEKKQGGGEGA